MTTKIYCECGFGVRGQNEDHATKNMEQHKHSKLHIKMMLIKNLDKAKQNENN